MRALLSSALILCWSLLATAQDFSVSPGDSSLSIHYRVQVGSFRNPSDLRFNAFKEVHRESFGGIYRYTVGFFNDFENASLYADTVKATGYPDAFVVGYLNGKRTSLKEIREAKARSIPPSTPISTPATEAPKDSTTTVEEVVMAKEETISPVGEDSLATEKSVDEKEIAMLRQRLNELTWMKVAIGQVVIGGAVTLGIVTGAWVPVIMGAAVVELYLLIESNYRFNRRDLRKLSEGVK
jgi:hypothetical protein